MPQFIQTLLRPLARKMAEQFPQSLWTQEESFRKLFENVINLTRIVKQGGRREARVWGYRAVSPPESSAPT